MAWRAANSLSTLLNQVNAAYPNRNKASDGLVGDSAHAAVASDHNPNSAGVVCALDLTHDPTSGLDAHALADSLIINRHPNLKYIISNRRIAGGWSNWRWLSYAGSNPHDKHIHISVGVGDDGYSQQPYDDTTPWQITKGNEDMITANDVTRLRIVHSEVAGWDGNRTHTGEFDGRFVGSYQGKDFRELIDTQWKAGAPYRAYRDAALDFYKQWKDKVGTLPEDDEAQIKEALDSLQLAADKVEAAKAKLNEAVND